MGGKEGRDPQQKEFLQTLPPKNPQISKPSLKVKKLKKIPGLGKPNFGPKGPKGPPPNKEGLIPPTGP